MKLKTIIPWTLMILLPAVVIFAQATKEPVPMDTCAMCHPDVVDSFAKGPHGRAMAARSKATLERACETCHGPAAAHVDNPTTKNINIHPKPAACLTCHSQQSGFMSLTTPAHIRKGVECLDCHVPGHKKPPAEPLLAAEPRVLCAKCHRREAAEFNLPFAHREGSKPFECTDCHSLHGTSHRGSLLQAGNGGSCIGCHTEKAGPFIYPHPPREVNGCLDCHQPHGSVNPNLLIRHRVSDLCLECHTNVPSFHDLTKKRYRNCQTCHVAVHGSNSDPRLFED